MPNRFQITYHLESQKTELMFVGCNYYSSCRVELCPFSVSFTNEQHSFDTVRRTPFIQYFKWAKANNQRFLYITVFLLVQELANRKHGQLVRANASNVTD